MIIMSCFFCTFPYFCQNMKIWHPNRVWCWLCKYDLVLSPVELEIGMSGDVVTVVIEAVVHGDVDGGVWGVGDVDVVVLLLSDVVEVLFVDVVGEDVVGEDVVGVEGVVGLGVGATIVVGEATRTSTKMTPKTAKKAKTRRSRKPICILRSIKSFLYSLIALA